MYIFILIGLFAIIAPFLTNDLKKYPPWVKGMVFALFISLGSFFCYLGARSFYKDFYRTYPPVEIKKYADEIFAQFNTINEKKDKEDVIDIKNESLSADCDDEECVYVRRQTLFEGADLDTNRIVTRQELLNFISSFDTDKNGYLSRPEARIKTIFKEVNKSEFELFEAKYGPGYGKSFKKELLSK